MDRKELFAPGTMTLGVNYWASHAATRMWSDWNESVVDEDMKAIAALGCGFVRVFPLWSDFQPVMVLRANCFKGGYRRGYAFVGERPLPDTEAGRAGVDEVMMERFERLCDIAERYGLKLIVPLLNGHMTFRIYNPPAVDGLDHFTDPESLMWQGRFIHYFVRRMKRHPAIAAWEIGNESNCMSVAESRAAAWTWTAFVTDAIRAEDNSRPVCSGMHALQLNDTRTTPPKKWLFADQTELCDILTSHPYPMWRNYINCDKPNTLRWSLLTALENQFYADISGTGAFAEEVGTLRRTFSTFESLGDQLRNVLWMLWSNDSRALLWWCAFDQTGMEFPPYDWDEAGMEHGCMTADRKINPTGRAIKEFTEFMKTSPVKSLPAPREKTVCVIGRDQKLYELPIATGILAKQAGLPIKFAYSEDTLPDARVYLIPCVHMKGGLNRAAYRKLAEKVENGATVYMSFDYNICVPEMEKFFGFEIESREANRSPVTIEPFGTTLTPKYRFKIKSHGAKPLDSEEIIWEYRLGKGRVIAAALPLELMLLDLPGSYQRFRASEFYRYVGEAIVSDNLLRVDNPEVVSTEHPESGQKVWAIIINCSPVEKLIEPEIKAGWRLTGAWSDVVVRLSDGRLSLPNNSAALVRLEFCEKA